MHKVMQAGKFKSTCLKVMDEIQSKKIHLVITKRNIPIVEIIPIEKEKMPLFGSLKGTVHIKGDLIEPIDEEWDACH